MRICPRCGVELDEKMNECPLCNYSVTDVQVLSKDTSQVREKVQGEKILSDFVNLTRNQKRKLFWELSNIILFSGILVTLMINVISAKGITWSKYSITICLVLSANVTLFSFWRHRLMILLGGSFLSTSLLLILLDLYNERMGWGTQLGIPLLFSLYMVILALTLVIRFTKQHGFNILGCFFLALGFLALCIDGILSGYLSGKIAFHWSLIVFVCMVPIAAILFHIHYRLNKGVDLKRFFHI
jgi:hypothetical protein